MTEVNWSTYHIWSIKVFWLTICVSHSLCVIIAIEVLFWSQSRLRQLCEVLLRTQWNFLAHCLEIKKINNINFTHRVINQFKIKHSLLKWSFVRRNTRFVILSLENKTANVSAFIFLGESHFDLVVQPVSHTGTHSRHLFFQSKALPY